MSTCVRRRNARRRAANARRPVGLHRDRHGRQVRHRGSLGVRTQERQELAALTGTNEDALYRLLRATASLGVFTELEDGRFDQTPLSEPLRSANPCLRQHGDDVSRRLVHAQLVGIAVERSDRSSAAFKVFGKSPWEVFHDQPDQAVNFNNAMTDMSQADSPAIAGAYDFSQFEHIVDVGGGLGLLLASVLQSAPALRGTLFEIPSVAEQADVSPILKPFSNRCQIQPAAFWNR